ncbi:MAG: ABC transporter ATP-binding protein [Deltaproteobacteria bacterium]|nr:ABC transporter ATP-binding protein [Deltaproteobacteria bacterium]
MAAENARALLDLSSLEVTYGPDQAPVVQDLCLRIERGQAVGILGESGAGKSTIALAILDLLPRAARRKGRIHFDGLDLLGRAESIRAIRFRRISLVLQDCMNAFNPVIRIGEQIAELWVCHERTRWKEALRRAGALLERFGLSAELTGSYPHELSGGMRQRVALAMAVALSPELVIVDEPTSALDVVTANAVVELLGAVRRESGASLLVISHDVSVLARCCDRIAVMGEGRILEEGPAARVLRQPEHAATRSLIAAVPRLAAFREKP